jgi:hypothetical protein
VKFEIQTALAGPRSEDHVLINVKARTISIAINIFTVYTFDLAGRLTTAVINGHTFRRSLENRIVDKWSIPTSKGRQRVRLWLNDKRKRALLDDIHGQIHRLFMLIECGRFESVAGEIESIPEISRAILPVLSKILRFDYCHLEEDAAKLATIYQPVGILPPDLYLSLVLQATAGCSYNRCSYCSFYEHQPFRVKSIAEFRSHVAAVKKHFSETINLRNALFLGEGNVLNLPQKRLLSYFRLVNDNFSFADAKQGSGMRHPGPRFRGIYSFMTAFQKNTRCANDFAELRAQNLRRIYIGMESGSNSLLRFLNKPGSAENVIDLVGKIKAGGVNVGLIILQGAGGDKYNHLHTDETIHAIRDMHPGQGDIIYFSPMIALPETQYTGDLMARRIHALTPDEMIAQKRKMVEGFRFGSRGEAPRIATYNIDEFFY